MSYAFKDSDDWATESYKIKEVGLQLSEEDRLVISMRLDELAFDAPSDSFIQCTFTNEWDQIRGSLCINSGQATFYSEFVGLSPIEVYDFMESEVRLKLNHWKERRFLNEDLIHLDFESWKKAPAG